MTMQEWFDAYGESHVNPTNRAIHWICVPLIFFSLLGILSLVSFDVIDNFFPASWSPYIHLGSLLILTALVFFVRLSLGITIGMALLSALMLYLVAMSNLNLGSLAWQFFVAIFVLSWIGQFIGHKIEGAKPSFFDDLKFLMIGPAWLLHFIYRKVGIPY